MTNVVQIDAGELAGLRAAAEHDDQVRELERDVTAAKAEWDKLKDSSLAAKKHYDQLVNELRELIAQPPDPQMKLFHEPRVASVAIHSPDEPHPGTVVAGSWKDRPIEDLGISEKMIEKLREIGVSNLGQAEKLRIGQVPGYENGGASVPGWGAKKVAAFEEALLALIPVDASGQIDDVPEDQVDVVEAAPVADDVLQAEIDTVTEPEPPVGPPTKRIRLTADIEGMEEAGYVKGSEWNVTIEGEIALACDGGNVSFAFAPHEYEIIAEQATEQAASV